MLYWAFTAAIISFLTGISLYIWNVYRPKGSLEQTNIIAWLLIAMTPVLILFMVFPESTASLEMRFFSASGAIALFVWIWIYGVRSARLAAQRDIEEVRTKLEHAENQIRNFNKRKGIKSYDLYRCRLKPKKDYFVGVATGELANISGIDLWVNSENTHMKMSRINERSISATIRYLGAEINDNGDISADTIYNELSKIMKDWNRNSVDPHTAIFTSPGRIAERGAKGIIHVASVQGQRGLGFTPVANVSRCVAEALKKANTSSVTELGVRSILIPIFGTGQAGGNIETTIEQLIDVAVQYTLQNISKIHEIYFLAYSELELDACHNALQKNQNLGKIEKLNSCNPQVT